MLYIITYESNGIDIASMEVNGVPVAVGENTKTADDLYIATSTDVFGNTTTFDRNSANGLLNYSETDSVRTTYQYDARRRLTSVQSGGSTVEYAYGTSSDTISHSVGAADGDATVTYSLNKDEFGRTSSVTVGGQILVTNTYDNATGALTVVQYANGHSVSHQYNSLDLLAKVCYNGIEAFGWEYLADGNVGLHTDSVNGVQWRYEYDQAGNISRAYSDNGVDFTYAYSDGKITAVNHTANGVTRTTSYTYDGQGRVSAVTQSGGLVSEYEYDQMGRVDNISVAVNGTTSYRICYEYATVEQDGTTKQTTRVSQVRYESASNNAAFSVYNYTYDNRGNIAEIRDASDSLVARYAYDDLNQLIREDNNESGYSATYEYDCGGNMTAKHTYAYTLGELGTADSAHTYTYGNANWGDLLTAYDGKAITYDEIGNMLTFDGYTYTWQNGRQLAGISGSDLTTSYKYNSDGIRTQKTVNGVVTDYLLSGSQILAETTNGSTVWFDYLPDGTRNSITYGGTRYFYVYNQQGDVVALCDADCNVVVEYKYDAWGKILSVSGTMADTLGTANPFRYRGYYYDTETGLYYVSSRYYNPEIDRWVSPEPNVDYGEFDEGAGLLGYNVYAYCANNPVMFKDETGESITLTCVLIGAGVGLLVGGGFGAHRANKKGYSPSDGWKYWKYVVGYGVAGGAVGALVGWGAGALIAKYGVATAATSITKGGGAKFSSFSSLKRSLGSAGKGFDWHHIVEQCQMTKSGFSKYWIQNSNNVVRISKSVHSKITAYYNRAHSFTNGMKFRNWLAGQDFKTQYDWGIKVLRMYGVKI